MTTSIVSREDLNYLAQQSSGNLNMILCGMTALMNDTDSKVAMMENQTWFQRMCRTISGKNKMTQQEIQRNHDKINMYMSQAMTELFEQQCIDRQIMMSLGNQLNELYAEHLQLKQMLGAFVSKLNEKIESIDNFHMLNTEIEQGIYSDCSPIVAICKILSQMDKRCIQDYRKMNILQRSMSNKGILSDTQITLADYLMSIAEIPMDEVGTIYIELGSLRGNFMANIILNMIENYHFLPDMARRLKNKQSLVESVIVSEQLEPSINLSINDVYNDFVNSKLDMIEGLLPISAIQYDAKMQEAEKLYLECKLDEAFELFRTLAEKGNGRAMYFVGEYYAQGYGKTSEDSEKAKDWRMRGRDAGDVLATLNVAYSLPKDSYERNEIFNSIFDSILNLAETGDVIAQNELADLYGNGYGCTQSNEEQLRWLKASAEGGYWRSMNKLGIYYQNEETYTEAVKWYRSAAEQGYDWGMYNLGTCYKDGKGVPQDYEQAMKWYKAAYELGNGDAAYWIGIFYYKGWGVPVDNEQEFVWMKRSAELGYDQGQCNLANCYKAGRGVGQDYAEAVRWYRKAADQNNADAENSLALCYDNGNGVEKDSYKAFEWYKRSAEHGKAAGQSNLAICYKLGDGCEQSWDKAKEWAMKAAKNGNQTAIKNLKEWFDIDFE